MNNYDMSSTGTNLQLSCFLDGMMARERFEEGIVKSDGRWFYVGGLDLKPMLSDLTFDLSKTPKEMFEEYASDDHLRCLEVLHQSFDATPETVTLETLMEFLEWDLGSAENVFEYLSERYSPEFEVITTMGYSQGDYAKVYVTAEVLQRLGSKGLARDIHHLFWDAPTYCRLDINGEEVFLEEGLDDPYEYEPEQILKYFKAHYPDEKYAYTWLEANLPDVPPYRG